MSSENQQVLRLRQTNCMDTFIGFVISVAILGGLIAGIYLFLKGKISDLKKWSELKKWANAKGYALPQRTGVFGAFWIVVGFICGIIPGLILAYLAIKKNRNYDREMRALMNKWVDAGRPLPPS